MRDPELAKACDTTAANVEEALAWIADPRNDPRIGQERAFLERALRCQAYQARRLSRSLERPMCVGVFGPSQAGKSYLVSVLARKGDTLTATFKDKDRPEVDFIREINPYGEKEATGLVTRFSVERPATPEGYPVALRLLTQTDLLKILANSYFFDGDPQDEQAPAPEEIDAHIRAFEARKAAGPLDVLREEDIWDLGEYFQHQIRKTEARVFQPFFDRMAHLAPRLSIADRTGLFSILWGRHEPLTTLYRTLVEALEKLGFAEDAFCPLAALLPATSSILNVATLEGLGQSGGELLKVTAGGRTVELPRPVVTALAAELRICLKEAPWPFLAHTDLLDFPGYRTRTLYNLRKFFTDAPGNALKELFLRGKVDYLFQRYTAEQELTSMLLCLRPSNLDVTTLPAVIDEWIGVTHGRTPQERRGRPVLLFFILTMFDRHLEWKAADEGTDPALRFEARMHASLLDPFAKVPEAWPLRWTPDQPFRNCFWIRNPNYRAEGIIQYEGSREVAVLPDKVERIATLREGYLRAAEVRSHFKDPERAFDEVMRLNDGGIGYLAESLAEVCRPGMKQAQVKVRLESLNRRVLELVAPHFVATDAAERVPERLRIAENILVELDECVGRQRFGSFLRGFCLDRARLADALYEARTQEPEGRKEANGAEAEPATRPRAASLLSLVKPAGAAAAPPPAKAARPDERNERLARSALQTWVEGARETADDDAFAATVGLSAAALREVAAELIATARRLGLEKLLVDELVNVSHLDKAELSAAKATIVAERRINGFVTGLALNGGERAKPVAFDGSVIPAEPENFPQSFIERWVVAFYGHVTANAQSVDGLVHDAEQNARLGLIVDQARSLAEGLGAA